jgi:hypothetical protein
VALRCELSPLVFTELYRLLAAERSYHPRLEECLVDDLGMPEDWLQDAVEKYEALWQQWRSDPALAGQGLEPEHAIWATWVLVGLRGRGSSDGLSSKLIEQVQKRYLDETADAEWPPPSPLMPVVCMWVLGAVVGSLDSTVPVLPGRLPQDENATFAYLGLVEHAMGLADITAPWPELMGSAILIRASGLAQVLVKGDNLPDQLSLSDAILLLLNEAELVMTPEQHRQLRDYWYSRDLVGVRDVLTHVRPKQDRVTFADAALRVQSIDDVRLALDGIGRFFCMRVSDEMVESGIGPERHLWRKRLRFDVGDYS